MPPNQRLTPLYTTDRPEIHDVVAEMRQVVDEFRDRVLIGEIYLPVEQLMSYYGKDLLGAHMPFNFALLSASWNAHEIKNIIAEYERALPIGAWPNWVLGNHDRPRIASRVGRDQARIAAMLLLTLRGTPTLYYGDEIGMEQVAIAPSQVRDPFERNVPGIGVGRDGCRTPMQWDADLNAGFSRGDPWLPLSADFLHENVRNLEADQTSILSLYRALIALRRNNPAMVSGSYEPVATANDLLFFRRREGSTCFNVVLNFGTEPMSLTHGDGIDFGTEILLSTHLDRWNETLSQSLDLRGNEGVITVRPHSSGQE